MREDAEREEAPRAAEMRRAGLYSSGPGRRQRGGPDAAGSPAPVPCAPRREGAVPSRPAQLRPIPPSPRPASCLPDNNNARRSRGATSASPPSSHDNVPPALATRRTMAARACDRPARAASLWPVTHTPPHAPCHLGRGPPNKRLELSSAKHRKRARRARKVTCHSPKTGFKTADVIGPKKAPGRPGYMLHHRKPAPGPSGANSYGKERI